MEKEIFKLLSDMSGDAKYAFAVWCICYYVLYWFGLAGVWYVIIRGVTEGVLSVMRTVDNMEVASDARKDASRDIEWAKKNAFEDKQEANRAADRKHAQEKWDRDMAGAKP